MLILMLRSATLQHVTCYLQLQLELEVQQKEEVKKAVEVEAQLFPRLQLFVTFCSVEPLHCAL